MAVSTSVPSDTDGRAVRKPDYAAGWQLESVDIPRVRRLSRDRFLAEHFGPRRPVVIEDATAQWPLRSKWSFDYFAKHWGDDMVYVSVGHRLARQWEPTTLGEYVRQIQDGTMSSDRYLRQCAVKRFQNLERDLGECEYCDPDRELLTFLWLGPGGTLQPFHKDTDSPTDCVENLFVQSVGYKYVALVSSDHDALMYKRPDGEEDSHFSRVEFNHPNRAVFPRFAEAVVHDTVLGPGDALYIPCNTWHFVQSLTRSISVSFWWRSDPRSV